MKITHRAQLAVKTEGSITLVRANAARLGQVMLNLVLNAEQAIPVGDTGEILVTVVDDARDKNRICVTVADTGRGIAKENLPRLFDPFFTTKAPGEGTGLGLAWQSATGS